MPTEHADELRGDRLSHLEPLRQRCARFAADFAEQIRDSDPVLPPTLHGRAADNWRHLFAVADAAGGAWPERTRKIAEGSIAGRREQTLGIMLLEDIRAIFAERDAERLSSTDIVHALGRMEDRPWAEWKAGTSITVRQLAKMLEPFNVSPTRFRAPGYTPGTRGYDRGAFADCFARFLATPSSPPSATAPQVNVHRHFSQIDPPHIDPSVADGNPQKPLQTGTCGAVADETAEPGTEAPDDESKIRFDELAAVLEFDQGLSRTEAEARAAELLAIRPPVSVPIPSCEEPDDG